MTPKKKLLCYIVIAAVMAVVVISGFMLLNNPKVNANAQKKSLLASIMDRMAEEPGTLGEEGTERYSEGYSEEYPEMYTETSTEAESTEEAFYATSHKMEPVSQDILRISDMYAAKGELTLKSYYPDASGYTWELYDMDSKGWELLEAETVYDELYRPVSSVSLQLDKDTMVRCSVDRGDSEEKTTDSATVKCIQSITGIAPADTKIETGAGQWLSSLDVPVKVTYQDNSSEILSGLYGLFFVDKLESSEVTYSDMGNMIETVTTVNTECEYSYMDAGEKELAIRYRNKGTAYDAKMTVVSTDMEAPAISDVSISDFSISNVDEPVTLEISITAEDNETPYPELEYAFLPQGTEPEDDDWTTKSKFEKSIDKNGIWIAYCRDRSGNTAESEKRIITVDQKAPELTLALENSGWCRTNKIIASAKDELPVMYLFTCPETGEDSGWTDRNECDVTQNGTWEVQAKDAVGNIASKEITVSNIDTQMPIIKGITEGEQIYEN